MTQQDNQQDQHAWLDGVPSWRRLALLYGGATLALLALRLWSRPGAAAGATADGRVLTPAQSPRLFRTLARLRARLDGPAITRVLVDDGFHAGLALRPRPWWRSWWPRPRHELVLGLPFLLAASPREALSAVARDYAHLCRPQQHHAEAGWRARWSHALYRQRRRLVCLHRQLAGDALPAPLRRRLDRFIPFYLAATGGLARDCEYAAERTASAVFGASANAGALVRATLLGRWIETQFWPTLFDQAALRPRPAFMPFSAMRTAFKASHASWARPDLLAAAWRQPAADVAAPTLRERLLACGQGPLLPAPVVSNAADVLLGRDTTRRLTHELDRAWWSAERQAWRARYGATRRGTADWTETGDAPAPE